jgi:hypothetical protein
VAAFAKTRGFPHSGECGYAKWSGFGAIRGLSDVSMNWQEQAATSHYQTAVAIKQQLGKGNVDEAKAGIEELVDALSRAERRALKSQLVRLMAHVLKWKTQPHKRSRSWAATIRSARSAVTDIQEDTPSLTDDVIRSMWDSCFESAKDQAESEIDEEVTATNLTWDEVFSVDYRT